jgi:hypothetical protein
MQFSFFLVFVVSAHNVHLPISDAFRSVAMGKADIRGSREEIQILNTQK